MYLAKCVLLCARKNAENLHSYKCNVSKSKSSSCADNRILISSACTDKTSKISRQKFFSQSVIDEWNQLPENVISADSVESFKKRLDNHMKSMRDKQ